MSKSDQPAGVAVDRGVRPVAEVCAGSLRWHIPMPDHVPQAAWLSGVHYLYDQVALDVERERVLIALREWAVSRWRAEVQHRPMVNKNRRSLDDCWRQVMRYAGLDPDEVVGPSHDALLKLARGCALCECVGQARELLNRPINIPFAGYDKNFVPGSNPDNPQDMPADCPTPDGCRPNGCHGACLPQSEPTKPDMRKNFEEWARDAQELDIRHKQSDSPLDRQQYESWVTALAWEAWAAATYEAWSFLVHQPPIRESNVRVRDPWVDKDGQWWAAVDDGCTYPRCECEQPEDAGCGRK